MQPKLSEIESKIGLEFMVNSGTNFRDKIAKNCTKNDPKWNPN